MTTILMAWRNLWRNKRRTLVTLLTVGSCTVILILSWGLIKGVMMQYASNITNLSVGDVQMHAPDYRKEQDFWATVESPDKVLDYAESKGVDACPRSYGFGLGAAGNKSAGTQFWGIRPELETAAFDLHEHIEQGSFLPPKASREVVLGKKLARSLNVEVGDELITLVQCADGSLGNELFTVGGVLKTVGDRIDRSAAILHMDDFEELFVSGGMVHQIVFNSHGSIDSEVLANELATEFPGRETLSWQKLYPTMADYVSVAEGVTVIFLAIYCIAASAGVLNTQLMATYDRMRELGVLKALGTPPWRIVRDVAAEAGLIGLLGTILGTICAWPFYWLLSQVGIDTTAFTDGSMSYSGVAFDPIWKAFIGPREVFYCGLVMCIFCVLASVYPAVLAARLDPVAAIRHRR